MGIFQSRNRHGDGEDRRKNKRDKKKKEKKYAPGPETLPSVPNHYYVNTSRMTSTTDLPEHAPALPARNTNIDAKKLIVRAIYDYEPRYTDDLGFAKDDRMEILSKGNGDDWWLAKNIKTKRQGYIPSNYVVVDDDSIESQDWWYSFNREGAMKQLLLPGNQTGTFLVRYSSEKDAYALSVLDGDKHNPVIRHFLIRKMDDGVRVYINTKQVFPSLQELVKFYRKPDNTRQGGPPLLTAPCPREIQPIPFKELEVPASDIKLGQKLGQGNFGEVYSAKFRNMVEVAVKTLKVGAMSPDAFLDEAKTMNQLRHRKLVQLLGVCIEPLYIITEMMSKGSLLDYLRADSGRTIKLPALIDMAAQVADGMMFLEHNGVIHRDLRAANVLVSDNNIVKVADFGLARMLEAIYDGENVYSASPEAKFPVKWTAPEALTEGTFSVKCDVWSYGILLYEMVTYGKIPYMDMDNHTCRQKVVAGYRMPNPHNTDGQFMKCECPDPIYTTMRQCWDANPETRPTFETLKHFFEDYPVAIEQGYAEQLID